VIVTTNLTPEELAQPADIGYSRIYDRILERCLAVKVDGRSRRRVAAVNNRNKMREQLGMEV
jgi:DNA replication protein DnaC